MLTDIIADCLTRIRNAQTARHTSVRIRRSKEIERFLQVLKDEGFVEGFSEVEGAPMQRGGHFPEFEVELRYYPNGDPLIGEAVRVSKPGRRIFSRSEDLPQVAHGLGVAIISTSQGVMSDRLARKKGVGGEVLARVS